MGKNKGKKKSGAAAQQDAPGASGGGQPPSPEPSGDGPKQRAPGPPPGAQQKQGKQGPPHTQGAQSKQGPQGSPPGAQQGQQGPPHTQRAQPKQGPPPGAQQMQGQQRPPPGAYRGPTPTQAPPGPSGDGPRQRAAGPPPGAQQKQGKQGPPHTQGAQQKQGQQGPPLAARQGQQGPPHTQGAQPKQGPPPGAQQMQGQQRPPPWAYRGPTPTQAPPGPSGDAHAQARPWGPGQQRQQGSPQGGVSSPPQAQKPVSLRSPPLSVASSEASPTGHGDVLHKLSLVPPGVVGRRIPVQVNHLRLNMGTLKEALHYDVSFNPETPKYMLRAAMEKFRLENFPDSHPAFDGRRNLYSAKPLPFGDSITDTVTVQGDGRPRGFSIAIKLVRRVDLSPLHDMLHAKHSPMDALQCVDIVLRNAPASTFITAGRCFFTPPAGQCIPLGQGMEMYYGFYQSAIRGWKPLLNVDVAHKAFPIAMDVLDLICDLGSSYHFTMTRDNLNKPLTEYVIKDTDKFLKKLKIQFEIPGQPATKRVVRANGLGAPAEKATFDNNGRQITVAKYFEVEKRSRLRYPHLPTISVGDPTKGILFPLEYCRIVGGQAVNRKMNENQTSAMIKKAATSTDVRKQKIMNILKDAHHNTDPCIREFGFKVGDQFEELSARVLPPPELLYDQNKVVRPYKGIWNAEREKFKTGATLKKWTVACATRYPNRDMEKFAGMLSKMARDVGMTIEAEAQKPFTQIGPRQSFQEIKAYFETKKDFDLIVVVIPNSGPQYAFVKQAAELNVGCLTQCIKERTIGKITPQTVGNIILKINSKLNGTNHILHGHTKPDVLRRPCMIMGADVTHPSPDARDIPSVAAVTASHDPNAFQYNICWRLQPGKMEIIDDLCNITIEQLKYFFEKTNGHKPERIIFFRDGVSEGQFDQVQKAEIRAIQKACRSLQQDGYEPAITFLVVQKRHHTRLFPSNPRHSEDRNCNVPAGTCVDTEITNPTMQDFYLVSHASIQGVAKPTKYCTLWDDNNMTNDEIQKLTYHLCHMFSRCNRSVSYPAPTYYAHLAAARAKVYIENKQLNMDDLPKQQLNFQIKDCIVKGKPMFFV